jgi:hypothetical protein
VGHQYSLARIQVTHYESFGVVWSHIGFFELDYADSSWINGKIRVGENVSIAKLHFTMTYINSEVLDSVGLTFRIFLNEETDYPLRSKAITIETYHTFTFSESFLQELYITFNETLKFGNDTVVIMPGEELSLRGMYEFDEVLYYKNGDVLSIPRSSGGGIEEITIENSTNPLLMFFLESIVEKMGQAGTVIVFITIGVTSISARMKRKTLSET